VTGGIDKALDLLEERTGTDFPLSDLLSDDPAEAVASGITSGGKVGTSTIRWGPLQPFLLYTGSR